MRGSPMFAQVLEDTLREWSVAEAAPATCYTKIPRPHTAHTTSRVADPFLFAAPGSRFTASAPKAPVRPDAARRTRTLAPSEANALTSLNRLGACLSSDYSAHELRRAFRRLARQYHPDRHPSCGAAEQARLAHVFSVVNEHHRCLALALERERRAAC